MDKLKSIKCCAKLHQQHTVFLYVAAYCKYAHLSISITHITRKRVAKVLL